LCQFLTEAKPFNILAVLHRNV